MTNLELAKIIVDLVGGKENVIKAANCMTRLRLTLKDASIVKIQNLKNTDGVLGAVENGNYLQVVLGPGKAKKVTDICIEELGLPRDGVVTEDWKGNKQAIKANQKENKFKKVAKSVKALAVPGSVIVKEQAEKEGLDVIFKEAGFEWREPGCSMCLAMNPDKLVGDQISASTSNRNFKGRQGSATGRTMLLSPAMVAAAAVEGAVTDVRDMI